MSISEAKWIFTPFVLASSMTSFSYLMESFSSFFHSLSTAVFVAGILKEGFRRTSWFPRDKEFRVRMIENHRGENLCRRWDAPTDEKSNTPLENTRIPPRWLHSEKEGLILVHWGINSISSKHCLPCNDCNKKQEKNHNSPLILANTNFGRHAVHLLQGGIVKVHGGLLIIPKVKKEMHQVWSEGGDLLFATFGKLLRKRLSRFQFISLQTDRLQLTSVCSKRRVVWRQHFKSPVFAMREMQEFGIQIEWTMTGHNWTATSRRTELCIAYAL